MNILTCEDLSTLVDYQNEKIAKIESAWQDAELRAENAEAKCYELIKKVQGMQDVETEKNCIKKRR